MYLREGNKDYKKSNIIKRSERRGAGISSWTPKKTNTSEVRHSDKDCFEGVPLFRTRIQINAEVLLLFWAVLI